jgi:hypothetical protein
MPKLGFRLIKIMPNVRGGGVMKADQVENMKASLSLLICATLSACSACSFNRKPCSPLECGCSQGIRNTSLSYLIDYGVDAYDVVASFDVRFLDGSSTNGCTAHIKGKYGEPAQSDELSLSGSKSGGPHPGQLTGTLSSRKKYYIRGVINRPDTEEVRQRNLRALSIHVEEEYDADYYRK